MSVITGKTKQERAWSLTTETNPIQFECIGTEPNYDWLMWDKAGHKHRWVRSKPEYKAYVSNAKMTLVERHDYWADDGEPEVYEEEVFVCRYCGEEINPWYNHFLEHSIVPGITEHTGMVEMTIKEYNRRQYRKTFQLGRLIPKLEGKAIITGMKADFPDYVYNHRSDGYTVEGYTVEVDFRVIGKLRILA